MLRSTHPQATDDLRTLTGIGEAELRRIMGNTRTSQRYKAECVIDAAHALLQLDPPIVTAADADGRDAKDIDRAYTSVRGLGWITAEYFRMLRVKADVMIVRFANAALAVDGLPPVGAPAARELVISAHLQDGLGVDLTAYEHAIWRTRGVIPPVGGVGLTDQASDVNILGPASHTERG